MFKLIHINKHLVDVFYGEEGWEPWSRVEKHKQSIRVVAGNKHIPKHIFSSLQKELLK